MNLQRIIPNLKIASLKGILETWNNKIIEMENKF